MLGSIPVCLSTLTTPHVDSCSRQLAGEGNTQSTLWLTGEVMKLIQLDTTSLNWIGELVMTQVSSFSWQTLIMMPSQSAATQRSAASLSYAMGLISLYGQQGQNKKDEVIIQRTKNNENDVFLGTQNVSWRGF